jgi:hypothetical protein
MAAVAASDARLFGIAVTGIVAVGGDHCPCALQFGRAEEHAFVLEERRLPNQVGAGGEVAPLRLSGPDTMPVDGLLRSLPALLTGRPAAGDLEFTLLGLATKAGAKRTAFVATLRLHGGAEPSELKVRLIPDTVRPFSFAWPADCSVDRWLRGLERATRRCPSFAPLAGG